MTKKPQKSPRPAAKKSAAKSVPPHPITHGKSLIYGDCLEVMNRWLAEGHGGKVDLIYLDPPFNSNAKYGVLYGKESANGEQAQVVAFNDTWEWGAAAAERMDDLSRNYSDAVKRTMDGLAAMLGESGMLAYLSYMAQRLIRCRDMLAEDGSIYLHCDPTASHYLKALMDAIFGAKNFRNEIVWHYSGWNARLQQNFNSRHDILFFYGNSGVSVFNSYAVPWTDEKEYLQTRRQKLYTDSSGGKFVMSDAGGGRRIKRYLKEAMAYGRPVSSVWEMDKINNSAKEALGYPTQKPLALLRRIILASSNKGGLVLDPFCGCGTTVAAANELKRKWIGIDISVFPVDLIRTRLHDIRGQIHVEGIPRDMKGARLLAQKPFEFEKWAVMRIPGMRPNEKQTSDGGIDGRGWLENDIAGAVKPSASPTPMVIAQVTVSDGINLNKIRALANSMEEKKALFGVYITPQKINPTASVRQIIAAAGVVKQGAREYPRLQLWSVEEYFADREANLPALATTRIMARGSAKAKVAQGDLDSESF